MTPTFTEARTRALLTLQSLRGRRDPSSIEFDVADRAISLALSSVRKETPYLVRDCLRNARSTEFRSQRRSRRGGVDFASPAAAEADPADFVGDERPDPFELVAWEAAYAQFTARVGRLGRHAERALVGLVENEPVEKTARETGISTRKLKSLRAEIRALSGSVLAGATI